METAQKFKMMDRETLKDKIDKHDRFHLWNALTDEYYKPDQNIPGSRRMPADRIEQLIPGVNAQKDDFIVTYCGGPKCASSKIAAEKLVNLGFRNVWAYEGGIEDWRKAGYPLGKLET